MRVFYTGDVHGSEKCWRKFLRAASFYKVDTLIMGGDITGKVLVPIVATDDGRHRARLFGREEIAEDAMLDELEQRVRFNGCYPYRCDEGEHRRLDSDPAYRQERFTQLMVEEVRRWIGLAEERLSGSGIRCLVMPGNDDEFAVDRALASSYVVNPDNRVIHLDDVQVLSCAWTNPTPWDSPREETESDLALRLENLAAQLDPKLPTIFNLHCPPFDTPLDRAPQLTADLRVIFEGGQPRIISVGSTAIREVIERYQPVVSLHGHIHESKAIAKLGRTTCVNPGSSYGEGVIDGAIVELRGKKLKFCQLVSG